MLKGDICLVRDIRHETGTAMVLTAEGHIFQVANGDCFTLGMQIALGPICGEWCYLELGNKRVRARIVHAASA